MEDPQQLRNFLRMTARDIEEILGKIGPIISKQDTVMRNSIPAKERLAVTLRFLATGRSNAVMTSRNLVPSVVHGMME